MVCGIHDLVDHFRAFHLDDPASDLLHECRKAIPNLEFILESALPKALPKMAVEEIFTSLTTIAALFSTSERELPFQFLKTLSRISSYFFSSEPKFTNRPVPARCLEEPLNALACVINSPKIDPKPISDYDACLFICTQFLTHFPAINTEDALKHLFRKHVPFIKNDKQLIETAALIGLCQSILTLNDGVCEPNTPQALFKQLKTTQLLSPYMRSQRCLDIIRALTLQTTQTDINAWRYIDEFCARRLLTDMTHHLLTADDILPLLSDIVLAINTSIEVRIRIFHEVVKSLKNRSISITYVAACIRSFRQSPGQIKGFVSCIHELTQLKWSDIHRHKELLKQLYTDLQAIETVLSYSEKVCWSPKVLILIIETLIKRAYSLKQKSRSTTNHIPISELVNEKNAILNTIQSLYTLSIREMVLCLRSCMLSGLPNELHVLESDNEIHIDSANNLKNVRPKIPVPTVREKIGRS